MNRKERLIWLIREVKRQLDQWNGDESRVQEKRKGKEVVDAIREERNGRPKITVLDGQEALYAEDERSVFASMIRTYTHRMRHHMDLEERVLFPAVDSAMEIEDIPRIPGEGRIWVWVEFASESVAEYTPPMPGFITDWSFPPPGSAIGP